MLQYDLSHQAAVLSSIDQFIDFSMNFDLSNNELITDLNQLIPAFKAFDQLDLAYSAKIQIFQKIIDLIDECRGTNTIHDYLMQLSSQQVQKLRELMQSERSLILEEIRRFRQQEHDNFLSFHDYLDKIFTHHYKVLVIRVDLGYRKVCMPQVNIKCFYHQIKELCKFMKDKNGIFNGLVGYGLALEQGRNRGYHAHLMLIYNGSKRQKDWYLADEVIKLWERITSSMGSGLNINSGESKAQYARKGLLGIGMIERRDQQAVRNAQRVWEYLVRSEKIEQMLLAKPSRSRSFLKGGCLKKCHSKFKKPTASSNRNQEAGTWLLEDTNSLRML